METGSAKVAASFQFLVSMRSAMDTAQRTIRIKWVRSGIGFDRSQSQVVRSLGLRRLNHVVERPDTPQVRGLVAKVAHLVEVVTGASEPVWNSTPAYTIKATPPEPVPASEEINVSVSPPAAGLPTPSSEANPVVEESASANSSARRAPTLSSVSATPSEESVAHENEGEKE
jgi:large subunit ribosomal protein L30